jgi:putative heme iron utilization protein
MDIVAQGRQGLRQMMGEIPHAALVGGKFAGHQSDAHGFMNSHGDTKTTKVITYHKGHKVLTKDTKG